MVFYIFISGILRNCCKTMKKKLPWRDSPYRNFNLDEMRDTRTLSKSWVRYDFVGLLVTIFLFSKNKHSSNSFHPHIFSPPRGSRGLLRNNKFIYNISVLFVLSLSISIYHSENRGIVERKSFEFTGIRVQNNCKGFLGDIYSKYSRNSSEKIYSFWHKLPFFKVRTSKYGNSFFDSSVCHDNRLLRVDSLFESEECKLKFKSNYYGDYTHAKGKTDRDFYQLGEVLFSYLRNWRESDEVLVKSFLLLRKKLNFHRKYFGIKNGIYNNVSWQWDRIKDSEIYTFYTSFEPFLMDKFNINTIGDGISKRSIKNIYYSDNYIEAGNIKTIRIQKYYLKSNLSSHLPPFNSVYTIAGRSFFEEIYHIFRKIQEQYLPRIKYLFLSIYLTFENSNILENRAKLKQNLIDKNNKLNLLINKLRGTQNPISLLLLLTLSNRDVSNNPITYWEHKLISDSSVPMSFILNNSIKNNYEKYLNQSLNNLYSKRKLSVRGHEQKNMAVVLMKLTSHIKNYRKWIIGAYEWVGQTHNWSFSYMLEDFFPNNSSLKLKSFEFLEILTKNYAWENINQNCNILQIPARITKPCFEFSQKFFRSIDQKLLTNPHLSRINVNDWIIQSFFDKSVPTYNSSNAKSNRKKTISFYSNRSYIRNCDTIYSKFLDNGFKSDKFTSIINNDTLSSSSAFTELRLSRSSLWGVLDENLNKTKFKSLPEFYHQYLLKHPLIENRSTIFVESVFLLRKPDRKEMKKPSNTLHDRCLVTHSNNEEFGLIDRLLSKPKDSKYESKNGRPKSENKIPRSKKLSNFNLLGQPFLVEKYIPWFFTVEWWEYNIRVFLEVFGEIYRRICDYSTYFRDANIRFMKRKLVSLWQKNRNLYNLNSRPDSNFCSNHKEKIFSNFSWANLRLIKNLKGLHWAVLTLISFVLLSYHKNISVLIGSDFLCLWKYFETIEYLTDTSQIFFFTGLMNFNRRGLNKTENSLMLFFGNFKHYVRNLRFYISTKKKMEGWLIDNESLDLSRRKKNLLVQSLITYARMRGYGFELYAERELLNNRSDYRITNQQGFLYFRYLSGILKKNFVRYPLQLTEKWVYSAFLQKILFSQALYKKKESTIGVQKIPRPLQFGISRSKGILLVGRAETGRSYLIKNSAANSYVPLLAISIDKFLYNKPDVVTESWMNILIESLRRLNLILDLAKGMSPCIIWIRNIHRLDVNRPTQNIESEPTFLLGILLNHFQNDFTKNRIRMNTIVIGSTHLPKKVDPALISPDRLDRVINVRLPENSRRQNQFFLLLNKKNLRLKNSLLYLNESDSRTVGYNARDLTALINEILLISITKNQSLVCTNTTELAFYRQILGSTTHMGSKHYSRQNSEILFYKIGRAIIQNILIEGSATSPLSIINYSWKKKFYYLSKWYFEWSIDQSIVKEFVILTHILGCLAGTAARDSWFLLEKNSNISVPLDKSVENDLDLASSISESLFVGFPWLEINKNHFFCYERETNNFSNIMRNETFAKIKENVGHTEKSSKYNSLISRRELPDGEDYGFRNTAWSPRFWRLSFSRSHLFDWMRRPNDSEFLKKMQSSSKSKEERSFISNDSHFNQLMGIGKEQFIYERILPRVRKRNVQELESQFEQILSEEQSEIMGFSQASTQYRMEYRAGHKPRLFIGKRILWDPIGSFIQRCHFTFSRREFFVDEEMLRRLYVTYGVRRERERSSFNHRIEKFFLCRGYNKEVIDELSVRWSNQLSTDTKRNIGTLKRIGKIDIRLKRPQIFTPVYLYQRWSIENIPEKFTRFELLGQRQRWLNTSKSFSSDSLTYTILSESYQYLLEFFLSKKKLLDRMRKVLLMDKWIFKNEIGYLIHSHNMERS